MRKYYTLDSAVKRSYKNKESFNRDNNTSFVRDLLNLGCMYFGLQPKFYYFDRKSPEKIPSPEPASFHKNDNEDLSYSEREKNYLDSILNDESDNNYRW
jgi:hypothetical protein